MTLGFIGLGIMGEAMCGRLLSVGGHPPVGYDAQPGLIDMIRGVEEEGMAASLGDEDFAAALKVVEGRAKKR